MARTQRICRLCVVQERDSLLQESERLKEKFEAMRQSILHVEQQLRTQHDRKTQPQSIPPSPQQQTLRSLTAATAVQNPVSKTPPGKAEAVADTVRPHASNCNGSAGSAASQPPPAPNSAAQQQRIAIDALYASIAQQPTPSLFYPPPPYHDEVRK